MKTNTNAGKKYFGAANGYSGFRSNFDKIFSPTSLDKLFIIKGGPGTGKSTLMRRIREDFIDDFDVTTILCSSDPDSLDGLLISKDGKTVGIADGTSPHTLDAKYPGAIEEIINLGDGFDFNKLQESRRDIMSLSENKKTKYESAYSSLKIAGEIYHYIIKCFLNYDYYNKAENLISDFLSDECMNGDNQIISNLLISSFSKNGYKRLPIFFENKRKITIKGDGISEYILLSEIERKLNQKCCAHRFFPSAFSENIADIIETESKIYTISDNSDCTVDSTVYMPKTCEYERLKIAYRCFIENSQFSLIKASEYHFKLEDIYSSAIAFEKNEEKYTDIINKINYIFDK